MNEENKDCNPDSPESAYNNEQQVNIGPVLSLQCLHDDSVDDDLNQEDREEEEEDEVVPFKILAVNGSSSISNPTGIHAHSSIPARNNWDGAHGFKIEVQCSDMPKKSESPVFSKTQNKLYIAKGHPFKIFVTAENVPSGSIIKVSAIFSLAEHSYDVVRRCPTHAQEDFCRGDAAYEHFVQCFSETAVYEKNPNDGKLSVSVPYEKPREGETYTTYLFKLTCFSSCTGGLNRRPFMLLFTLEKDNIPLGRQTIEAKVCACPVRDFKADEEKKYKRKYKANKIINNEEPSTPSSEDKISSKYSISVKDPELYLFLKQMQYLYETCAYTAINSDT